MQNQVRNPKSGGTRIPTLVARTMEEDRIAVRFEQIGDRSRFGLILQRFRFDFLLAECQEINNQKWWIVTSSQEDEIVDFCKRNGLKLEKR